MTSVGQRIKKRRLELGMSVDELAKKLGKNRATVYRYESDAIENLPVPIVAPLAKALQCSPATLMGWEEDPNIVKRDYLLEQIDVFLEEHGYSLQCESYDDPMFIIRNNNSGECFPISDGALLTRYEYALKNGSLSVMSLIHDNDSMIMPDDESTLLYNYRLLNDTGKARARDAVSDLTQISKYLSSNAVQFLGHQKEDNDIIPLAAHHAPGVTGAEDEAVDEVERLRRKYEKED